MNLETNLSDPEPTLLELKDRIRAFAQQVDAEAPAGFVVKFVGERIRLRSGIDRHRIAPFG